MASDEIDYRRRRILTGAATAVGGIGVAYVATPFVLSMDPSLKAQAAGSPIDVDISKLKVGQLLTVEWRGKPIWILRRDQEIFDRMNLLNTLLRDPDSNELSQQPHYAKNSHRFNCRFVFQSLTIS